MFCPRNLFIPASVVLLMFCFFGGTVASNNPSYDACKKVVSCGNVTVMYPFWIENEFCGRDGFRIICDNRKPFFDLPFGHYLVENFQDKDWREKPLELRAAGHVNATCLSDLQIHSSLAMPKSNQDDKRLVIRLFYNCNSLFHDSKASRLTCGDKGSYRSYIVSKFDSEARPSQPNESSEKDCESVFKMHFNLSSGHGSNNKTTAPINYTRIFEEDVLFLFLDQRLDRNCVSCNSSGGMCGRSKDDHFQCFCSHGNKNETCTKEKDTDRNLKIGLGTGIGALAAIVILLTIFIIRNQRMSSKFLRNNNSAESSLMSEMSGSHVYFEVPIFQNKELEEATNNFHYSQELGDGGFGTVYYGKLRDGREVAVKRLYEHNYRRVKQFMTEVQILTRLQHKNLVSLSRELLLVYEYVPNGTVSDHLHGDRSKECLLPWHIRMNIAIETANALAYLHASDIIHRDVKTNNILLDKNFGVKVGDFGLSRLFPNDVTHVSTAPQGTPGYVDPEYHQCYQLTEKSDVYSFGVVLVELISSMPAVDISRDRHEINLSNLAINRIQRRALQELVDPSIGFDSDARINEMINGVAELALMCLQHEKEMRPGMSDVVEELKAIASPANVANSKMFSPSPERDEARLLRKTKFPTSPKSVTEKWVSSGGSGTPTTSAKTF